MESRARAIALFGLLRSRLRETDIEYLEIEIEDEEYDSAIEHLLESAESFSVVVPRELAE